MSLSNSRSWLCVYAGLLALLVMSFSLVRPEFARAQSIYGQISGTVTDPKGGTVARATVQVTDQNTKAVREVETDASGDFRVPSLGASLYTITIKASGFADAERKDVELLARQELRLDTALTVASAPGQVVEVKATEAIVSDSNTISDSRSGAQISDLALNFRATDNPSPLNVAVLTPGVQQDKNGNVSVAGGLPYFTSFSIDGVNTTNVRFNGPNRDLFPSIEGIAEFKVNTANNNAEFGQPSDLTVTTRSGSSDYHGAIYDYYQNSALNAFNSTSHTRDFLIGNTFGGYFGGPLSVPHVLDSKNKTFFYFDYEGTRRPRSPTVRETVPPDAWRGGDLSSICLTGFTGGICNDRDPNDITQTTVIHQIYSPFTGSPIPNNQITPNPTATAILNALYPHQKGTGTSLKTPNFTTTVPGPYVLNTYDGRLDHNFTPNHKIFGRVSFKDINDSGIDTNAGTNNGYNANFGQFGAISELRNVAVSYSWVINSHLVNELRGGLSFAKFLRTYPLAAQGGAIIQQIGLTGLPPTPKSGGIPNFNFTGGNLISSDNSGRPRNIQNHTYVIGDNLTWLKGPHTFKFGVDYSHLSYVDFLTFFNGDEFGEYFFTGILTRNPTTRAGGLDFADFLFGLPTATTFAQNGPDTKPFTSQYGFYAQDEWKLTRNLTFTYGLRYEIHPPFNDETNQLANFDRFTSGGRVVVQNAKGLAEVAPTFAASIGNTPIVLASAAGLPETLRKTYYGDWDPRVGVAWRPFGNNKTVLRANAGVYTVPVLGSVLYSLAGVATSNAPVFQQALTGVGPNGAIYALQFPNVFPAGAGGTGGGIPDFRRANQVNLKDPRNIQWGASVERDLGWQTLLRVSYVGTHTTNLIHSPDLNQVQANTTGYAALIATPALRQQNLPFSNFNAVLTRDNGPSAKYNVGTVEVTKRFGAGLNFQSSYGWSKNLSNALGPAPSAFSAENGPTTLNRFDTAADYGNVVFTRRNRFLSTFFWDLPVGNGKKFMTAPGGAANAILGNWSVAGILLAQSGPYLTPTFSGTDPSGTGVLSRGVTSTQRPDCVGTPSLSNISAFAIPADNIGRFGNCGVGILDGPGTTVFSATVGKQFKFTERAGLKFEAQFANLFNHLNKQAPSTNISSSSYGVITAVQTGEQAGPRTIQFGLRLFF
jgi:hypothetical protein